MQEHSRGIEDRCGELFEVSWEWLSASDVAWAAARVSHPWEMPGVAVPKLKHNVTINATAVRNRVQRIASLGTGDDQQSGSMASRAQPVTAEPGHWWGV